MKRFDPGLKIEPLSLSFKPLTPKCWPDFEKLFGLRGACAGCWCMFWKLANKEFRALAYEGNKAGQKAMVDAGIIPGVLAYSGNEAIGWIAVEPRDKYPRLARSRVLKPIDDQPVWSVTCFFTRREYRGVGVTVALLKAAIEHVKKQGGKIVEGYPIEPNEGKIPAVFAYTGLASAFRKAGFKEVRRNSARRPIFRIAVED
jgi:GNAT superfamily N-acetyltransferase